MIQLGFLLMRDFVPSCAFLAKAFHGKVFKIPPGCDGCANEQPQNNKRTFPQNFAGNRNHKCITDRNIEWLGTFGELSVVLLVKAGGALAAPPSLEVIHDENNDTWIFADSATKPRYNCNILILFWFWSNGCVYIRILYINLITIW